MGIIFTPVAVLDLLNQIDELKDYNIGMQETPEGTIQFSVGESTYEISPEAVEEVEAPEEVVDTIEDINDDAFEDLLDSEEFEEPLETVESGIVKEAIKSLLLGGAIKLIKKLL